MLIDIYDDEKITGETVCL